MHCNTLQHTAPHCRAKVNKLSDTLSRMSEEKGSVLDQVLRRHSQKSACCSIYMCRNSRILKRSRILKNSQIRCSIYMSRNSRCSIYMCRNSQILKRQLATQFTKSCGKSVCFIIWQVSVLRNLPSNVYSKGSSATHCNTLQHTATHCNTLQHSATHCDTLQHTATHCNTLQHTAFTE